MSLFTAADLPDHKMVSVVIPCIESDYSNHSPLSILEVSQGGQRFTIHIYRGKRFHDKEGEAFTPLGCLTLHEYQLFRPLLGGVDESGNEIPRRLFMEWEKIDFMVSFMRQLACHLTNYSDLISSVPAEMTDAANLAIEVTFGAEWNLSNLTDHPSQNEVITDA